MPTTDLAASLALYRDGLGWPEAWREGDSTVVLTMPGAEPDAIPGYLAAYTDPAGATVYVMDQSEDVASQQVRPYWSDFAALPGSGNSNCFELCCEHEI